MADKGDPKGSEHILWGVRVLASVKHLVYLLPFWESVPGTQEGSLGTSMTLKGLNIGRYDPIYR